MDKVIYKASGVCSNKNEYFELVKMQKRHKERKLRPVLLFCGFLSIALCIYDLIIIEHILALMSAGFAFLLLYPTTFSYIFEAQQRYDTDKNRVLNVTMTCTFYDNRFSVMMKDKESFHSYNKINDIRLSKRKLYFFTEDKTYYIDKKRLEDVTLAELKAFLNEMRKK